MRRVTSSIAVASIAALVLTGCILPPKTPQQLFVEEAEAVIDAAGGMMPAYVPADTPRDEAILSLRVGMCEGFESAGESDASLFGVTTADAVYGIAATALAEALQMERDAAVQVLDLAVEHLLPWRALMQTASEVECALLTGLRPQPASFADVREPGMYAWWDEQGALERSWPEGFAAVDLSTLVSPSRFTRNSYAVR